MVDIHKLITNVEKTILALIALFTVYGVGQEMYTVIETGAVKLTDLLLM
ncbi:MAG: phosphate starvation-inducible protein PhoH, partial [Betaproteobacteria bacterium]|nr:phosphate starvation-inducible protein PhoH [Betaproteobacteria bacterium]